MAARTLRPRHQEEIRAKIQVSQLLNRLSDCALKNLELRPDQLKSIEILLKKSLPDLSAIEITGEGGGPIRIQEVRRTIVKPG